MHHIDICKPMSCLQFDLWQSCVEIQHYSIAYFDCVTVFEMLQHKISVVGGDPTCYIHLSGIDAPMLHV